MWTKGKKCTEKACTCRQGLHWTAFRLPEPDPQTVDDCRVVALNVKCFISTRMNLPNFQLLHLRHQEASFSINWCSQNGHFDAPGIIFHVCICKDRLTLQTVPFHYLHCRSIWTCAVSCVDSRDQTIEKLKPKGLNAPSAGLTEPDISMGKVLLLPTLCGRISMGKRTSSW